MEKYQEFRDKLAKIKEEEERVGKEYMKVFLSDVEQELIKHGAIVEEVDKNSLGIRDEDTWGTFSCIKGKMKIFWFYKKIWGMYPTSFGFDAISIYEIGVNKKGEKTFKCPISTFNPTSNLLNDKKYNYVDFLNKYIPSTKKRVIEEEFKRDTKKYNL